MLRPNPSLFPRNGYTHQAHGRKWTGDSWGDLAQKIENHRRAAGIPVGKPLLEIYEEFCRSYPRHCVQTELQRVIVDITNTDVGFGMRVVQWVANNATKTVSPKVAGEVANTRASICQGCPEQSDWKSSCGCSPAQVEKVAKAFFNGLGHGPSPDTNGLKACRAMNEDCRLSVWMNQSPKNVGQPPNCWRLV